MHWPLVGRRARGQIREAFDRAIALDSAFGPAYIHPVEVALQLGRPAAARRYLAAYLALDRADMNSEGMGLVERLLVRPQPSPAIVQGQIDTASSYVLLAAWSAMRHLPDSAETDVALARALGGDRPGGRTEGGDESRGTVRGGFRSSLCRARAPRHCRCPAPIRRIAGLRLPVSARSDRDGPAP